MARLVIGILIGAALGLAAGWVVFEEPFASDPPTQADVEREAARVSGQGYANCRQRQFPTNVWDCMAQSDRDGGLGNCDFYVGTVTDDRVAVEQRDRAGIDEALLRC